MCITDKEKTQSFYVNSNNEEIRLGDDTSDIINKLTESFLNNYQKEEQILRNGSNYTFESFNCCIKSWKDWKKPTKNI